MCALVCVSLWTPGGVSVYAGTPGRHRPQSVDCSSIIEDWHQCVKSLTVSSKESQAHHLIDGQMGYWQSSGTQGKVLCYLTPHMYQL